MTGVKAYLGLVGFACGLALANSPSAEAQFNASGYYAPPLSSVQLPAAAAGYPSPAYGPPGGAPCLPYGAAEPCPPRMGPTPVDACCVAPCCPPGGVWSGRVGALLLFRDDENHEFFSYDNAIQSDQLLDFREAQDELAPGVEARLAWLDCCTLAGWEGVYWGVFPADATAYAYASDVTGDLNPILNFDQLDYNGAPASASVNDAQIHRLRRTSEIHNAEINRLWTAPLASGDCGSPWTMRMLVGFRYFRFEEGLEFASDVNDTSFTGEPDELYYTIDADNNLFGLQLGGRGERAFHGRWSFTCGAKAGVFCNHASATSHIGGAAGTATVNNGPNNGRPWLVSAEKDDVAFIGELQVGLACELAGNWRAVGEYRVISASGLALPTNQIFHDLRGLQDVQLLATNGNLLLHGVFVGLERRF